MEVLHPEAGLPVAVPGLLVVTVQLEDDLRQLFDPLRVRAGLEQETLTEVIVDWNKNILTRLLMDIKPTRDVGLDTLLLQLLLNMLLMTRINRGGLEEGWSSV